MARYSNEHKQRTRARILDTAARRFRSQGLDGSGVAAVMGDAGLTNGAFYSHFSSKDDLVGEVVVDQIARQADVFEAAADEPDGLERVIDAYLSPRHRDDLAGGCVSAALLGELAHATPDVRARYASALPRMIAAFRRLAGMDDGASDAVVLARFAVLVGTVQFARSVQDATLSTAILDEGKRNLRALLAGGGR
jgi:TetR/AcrR family transcriptional repressor of nem operon